MKKKRMNGGDNGYDDDDESTSSTDDFLSEPKEVSSGEEMNLPADSDEKLLIRLPAPMMGTHSTRRTMTPSETMRRPPTMGATATEATMKISSPMRTLIN
jgi:hypothetical protein